MSGYITKEAELNEAILRFASRCLAEGDLQMLAELGFKRHDVQRLQTLRVADLCHLAGIKGHMLKPVIDRNCFYKVLAHIDHHRENETVAHYLLEHDAPLDMLHALFGMSGGEYADRRRMLGIESGTGRTREPREDEELAVWETYQVLGKDEVAHLTAHEWVEIFERCEVPLRNIWQLVNRWSASGDPLGDPRDGMPSALNTNS